MRKICLDSLRTIASYDGPKLLADLDNFRFYKWNGPDKNNDFDSMWIEINCSACSDMFISLLAGNAALRAVMENENVSLRPYALNFDDELCELPELDFSIEYPKAETTLKDICALYAPQIRQICENEFFGLREVNYGGRHLTWSLTSFGHDIINCRTHPHKWKKLLESLKNNWSNLFESDIAFVTYDRKYFSLPLDASVNPFTSPSGGYALSVDDYIVFQKKEKLFYVLCGRESFQIPLGSAKQMFEQMCTALENNFSLEWQSKGATVERATSRVMDTDGIDMGISMATHNKLFHYFKRSVLTKYNIYNMKAAARMLADQLSDDEIINVFESLREIPACEEDSSEELRKLLQYLPGKIHDSNLEPYDQGYLLAAYVRDSLALPNDCLDIEGLLKRLAISTFSASLGSDLLALAIWRKNGAVVILNDDPRALGSSLNLRRSSMCHELSHVLADRGAALPLGEVLTRRDANENIEKRARAFAAELLLPRSAAAKWLRNNNARDIGGLARAYEVSRELAAWQIHNGGKKFGAPEESVRCADDFVRARKVSYPA